MIRRARPSDLPAIAAIYNEAVLSRDATADSVPRTLADRRRWLRQFGPKHPLFVAEEAGTVVGYGCLMAYSPKDGYRFTAEHSVYVAGSARGRGLGRRMLRHLVRQARRLRLRYLLGRVFAHNPASLALHRASGFRVIGTMRRAAVLDGRWRDVVLLEKRL